MLVLSRKVGEEIIIGNGPDAVRIVLVEIKGPEKVRIGIVAPRHISVHRKEVAEAIERKAAEEGGADATNARFITN